MAYIELTTSERMPINIARIRRDNHSIGRQIRIRYLNICSNVKPNAIELDGQPCDFKITRGHEVIKVNIGSVVDYLPSGIYEMKIKLFHDAGVVEGDIKIDFKARSHHNKTRNDPPNHKGQKSD